MKRFLKICSIAVLTALAINVGTPSKADIFTDVTQINTSAFYGAGGYIYRHPEKIEKDVVDLGYKVNGITNCGDFNLSKTFRDAFATSALNGFLRGLGITSGDGSLTSIISSSPLLLMSYVSPTMANTYMHVKNTAEKIVSIQQKQCESLQNMATKEVGVLAESFAKARFRCVSDKVKDGESLGKAIEECKSGSTGEWKKVTPLTAKSDSSDEMAKSVDLTKEVEKIAGLSGDKATILESIIGKVAIDDGAVVNEQDKNAVTELYDKDVREYDKTLQETIDSVATGHISKTGLQKIYDETGVVISPQVVVDLYNMSKSDPYKADIYRQMLASKLALYKLNNELIEVEKAINLAKQKAEAQGNQKIAKLLDKKEKIELERKALENRQRAAQESAELALKTHQERERGVLDALNNAQINGVSKATNTVLIHSTVPSILRIPSATENAKENGRAKEYIKHIPKIQVLKSEEKTE